MRYSTIAVVLSLFFVAGAAGVKGTKARSGEAGSRASGKEKLPEDNRLCLVCHLDLRQELIAKGHEDAGIVCASCHGLSMAHMHDEMLMTKPDNLLGRKEVEPLDDQDDLVDHRPDPERQVVRQEEVERLADVITRLLPDYQQVLVLRYIEGLSTDEVAAILNRSNGAVRVLLHRALKQMTSLMVAEEVEGD